MIKENQKVLNRLHVISDGLIVFLSFPLAYWIRYVLLAGERGVTLSRYMLLALGYTAAQLFTYAAFGLYQSFRQLRLRHELARLWEASMLDFALLQSLLFLSWGIHYSRLALGIAFALSVGVLSLKRFVLRRFLRRFRQAGYNLKNVLIVGNGHLAAKYINEIRRDKELGYRALGYVCDAKDKTKNNLLWLGGFEDLETVLEREKPDEVVAALEVTDYERTPEVIAACEQAGIKLSIIPFFMEYMPSNPQFDDLNGIPMLNIRHIPLDNWANAFVKRAVDVVGSAILLILTSPLMLFCAAGVKLTSRGPVIFKQERVGRNNKNFSMYKFRSMRVNDAQDTAWSRNTDDRKTAFGSFMRKCSLDELPQFWNVLKGDMSLVGPRPEIPHFVEHFKKEVPLYMVKHQVRPGITGWAQVNGYRGDTSIPARIEHDIYYIEHWNIWFDFQILLMTVFGGKFLNSEVIAKEKARR